MESKIIDAIQNQIDAATPILQRLIDLHPVSERPQYGPPGLTRGKIHYNRTTVGSLLRKRFTIG